MRFEPQPATIQPLMITRSAVIRLPRNSYLPRVLIAGLLLVTPLMPAQTAAPASGISAAGAAASRPADLPASPPQISCSGGQLSITAENSSLASIFAEVQKCIGVRIDFPGGSDEQRTYLHLGPGPAHKILLALLESTDFNYVLQPSDSDPAVIHSVLLMARNEDTREQPATDPAPASPTRRAWLDQRRRAALSTRDPSGLSSPGSDNEAAAPSSSAERASDAAADPAQAPAPSSDPAPSAPMRPAASASVSDPAAGAPAPTISSSTQLQEQITNMQQMFEERKRMAQQSPGPPSAAQPH